MGPSDPPRDPEARRRIGRAVQTGEAVSDPAEAAAAVELARSAQVRLRAKLIPSAVRVGLGTTVAYLVLVALPTTLAGGWRLAGLLIGLSIGALLFAVTLLLGQRQLRLARQAEARNLDLLRRQPPSG